LKLSKFDYEALNTLRKAENLQVECSKFKGISTYVCMGLDNIYNNNKRVQKVGRSMSVWGQVGGDRWFKA